jgi:hypothetical protein
MIADSNQDINKQKSFTTTTFIDKRVVYTPSFILSQAQQHKNKLSTFRNMASTNAQSSTSTPQQQQLQPYNPVVDDAFQRLFGYSWYESNGTDEDDAQNPLFIEMMNIFGSKQIASRILKRPLLHDLTTACPPLREKDPAALLTTKIIVSKEGKQQKSVTTGITPAAVSSIASNQYKRRKINLEDYKSIDLPKDIQQQQQQQQQQQANDAEKEQTAATSVAAPAAAPAAATAPAVAASNSNLDTVLQQLSGPKRLNTVEKTSNDWESFKDAEATLKDELERTAQSKNAYLVKQDFLNRVDQRTFEIEKTQRDKERTSRQLASASGSAAK